MNHKAPFSLHSRICELKDKVTDSLKVIVRTTGTLLRILDVDRHTVE
jgi:hypothetical protein